MAARDDIQRLSRRRFLQGAAMGAAAAALGPAGLAQAAGDPLAAASNRDVLVFEGVLTDATGGMIHLDVKGGAVGAAISPASSLWRGGAVGVSDLRIGDDILMHVRAGYLERGWANLSRVRGVVTGRSGSGYVVLGGYGYGPASDFGLQLSSSTRFIDGATGGAAPLAGLAPGTTVDAIGLMDDTVLRATILSYVAPGVRIPKRAEANPDSIERTVRNTPAGPLNVCDTTYWGYASWFYCYSALAKCETCSSSTGGACAWPNVSPPPGGVCNDTSGCKNQSQAWCGKDIDVHDRCSGMSLPCAVVECGPCQNNNCSPNLCGQGNCGPPLDCNQSYTPIVDLTRATFSLFYDPNTRGCFSCYCINTINC